jgi:hypothetical protein
MIVGLVESMTPRSAQGWVRLASGHASKFTMRAMDGADQLACVEVDATDRPVASADEAQRRPFNLEFPVEITPAQLDRVVVEARNEDGTDWNVIERRMRFQGPYLNVLVPPPVSSAHSAPPNAYAPSTASAAYWSGNIAAATSANVQARPIFIVGAVRSGTTAMGEALSKGTRYQGFPEGHVLDLAIRLMGTVHFHFDCKERFIGPAVLYTHFQLGRFGRSYFMEEIIGLLRRTAAGYKTPYWFDKTPSAQMVASVPYLLEAFPEARFLFMQRRGLENIASRLRKKFTGANFTSMCRDWQATMASWRAVRGVAHGRYVEIEQRDMKREPAGTAAAIGGLMDFDAAETSRLADAIRQVSPQVTDPSATVIADVSSLGWTQQQIDEFRATCGQEMEAYGYTYDSRYRLVPAQATRSGS